MTAAPAFTCPDCGTVSAHPDDLAQGYCGRCHRFTGLPARPRAGSLRRADGTAIDVRFVATDDPTVFLGVSVDGERIMLRPGDTARVDLLGAGQSRHLRHADP